ncbi:hypothetical protein L7F22_000512 [Adiantum nelumboides]|nr:hypothetical protein [Adiantum nelumboides]
MKTGLVPDCVGTDPNTMDESTELCRACGKVKDQEVLIFFDGGAKANFISLELAARLEITPDRMGPPAEAVLATPGKDVAITPVIGKLRLHCQGYLGHENFYIMPLEGCEDLKVLQSERRKLEMRAKTTVYFQTLPKDVKQIVEQDSLGGEHLLIRRKAEVADPSFSGLGTKRQRITRSPVRDERSKKSDSSLLRRNHYEKKADVPTLKSSFDVSTSGALHNKDLQSNRHAISNMERMDKALLNYIQRQRQFNAHKYLLESSIYAGVKRNYKSPPGWVERLTQGNRTNNINRFFMREAAAGLVTKNLVQRKSVRPPGSIFKASNPIHWTAKPFSLKDISRQNNKGDKTERGEVSEMKCRVNVSAHETGPSSKSAQKMSVAGLNEELIKPKYRSLFANEPLKIEECQTGYKQGKNDGLIDQETKNRRSLEENIPTSSEALNTEDVKDGLPENIPGTSEQQLDKNLVAVDNIKEKNTDEGSLNLEPNDKTTRSRSLWDANFLTETGVHDSKKDVKNNVTQDDLLALTLRSILNSQPSPNIGFRLQDEANNANYSGIDELVESGPPLIEEDRKQNYIAEKSQRELKSSLANLKTSVEVSERPQKTSHESVEVFERPRETVAVEMRTCKEPPVVAHDVEEPDPFSKQPAVQTKTDSKLQVGEQKEAQTEPSQIEWPPDSLELSMVSERPRNTDFDSR